MRDRLTERVGNGIRYDNGEYYFTCYPKNNNLRAVDKLAVKLCDLEDKIENGAVIVLPCKVGDKAYHLTGVDALDELNVAEIFEGKVCSISKDEKTLWIFCRYYNGLNFWYTERDIGRNLFLTREEAEKALAERSGE